jgi:hypothetical protein
MQVDTGNFPMIGSGYLVMAGKQSSVEWSNVIGPSAGSYTLLIKVCQWIPKNEAL